MNDDAQNTAPAPQGSPTPTVSVLIPVYNGAAYVAGAVDSALAQQEVDLEVIVVDDGSTDETPKILDSYGNRIRVVRRPNAGHVAARNFAAGIASGQWLAFLDADDAWHPAKLAKQLQCAAADPNAGLVYTERMSIGDLRFVAQRQSDCETQYEGDVFEPLLINNFITVSSVLIRTSWFRRLGGFDPEPYGCEDWDLWLRYVDAGGTVRVCREPLTYYRWHSTSMSCDHPRMLGGRQKVLQRALKLPRGQAISKHVVARAKASLWNTSAWHATNCGDPRGILWYLTAAYYWPWNRDVYRQIARSCAISLGRLGSRFLPRVSHGG